MRVLETEIKDLVIETVELNIGTIHLLENVAISEIKEGLHLNLESSRDIFTTLLEFYKNKPFGYISNRINSFSVETIHCNKVASFLKNLKVYAAVTGTYFSKINTEIEKGFTETPYKTYDCIIESYKKINYLIASYKQEDLSTKIN